MPDLTSDQSEGFEDVIANQIPSRAFRYTCENKNVLAVKGAMYVGTGDTRTTSMNLSANETIDSMSYITGVLNPPQGNGTYVLKCVVNNGNATVGWVKESDEISDSIFNNGSQAKRLENR